MAQSRCKVAKPSVGIDLGTTYSCVAVFQNGRPEVIANSQGNRITPSVVAFTKDGRLVGEGAEIQRKLDPPNAIYNAKRFIGRMASDAAVQASHSAYPFRVMEVNNKIQFAVSQSSQTVHLTPEEVAAAILSKMKKTAEDYLEETVEDVVITVPAYFTDSQRQATINAGQIAGLKVTRIINEPTAAAMAYGLREGTKDSEGKHILVYDLGGGTFDVSVLEIEEDLIQVKATAGDSNLGGEDFNNILVNHFKQEVLRRFKFDLTSNFKAIRRLTGACEKLKRNLSAENVKESKIELDNFLPEGRNFVSTLTRAKFENLCKDRFDETIKCVEKALLDANLIKEEINEIVLVGGSSRIPKLQSMLSSFFNNKTLNKSINPDEAVACGAAVQAAIINNNPHLTVRDLLLMDVIPLSIGVNTGVTIDGITTIVMERNTAIPVRKTKELCTTVNNQTACSFSITEGERTMTRDNRILGSFEIYGLPPKKAGEVLFDTEFDIDENGILTVSATVRGMNKKAGITLNPRSTGNLSDEEVTRLVFEAKKMKVSDQNEENRTLAMNKLISLCNHVIFVIQDLSQTDTGDVHTFGDILNIAENCLSWIRQHPDAPEGEFISRYNSLSAEAEHVFNLSTMLESSSQSSHVLRMSQQTAKSYLKEGRSLLQSSSINDIIKASEYFYKAYKTASEGGKLLKQIEALVCFGHTHTILFEAISEEKVKLNHAFKAIKGFSSVMAIEENKTLSEDERNSVIGDLRSVVDRAFKIIDNLSDNKKYNVLDSYMRVLDKKNAAVNPEFCQILFQCRIKEIKMVLKRIETCIVNENNKEVQNFIQTINYPKEQAKLLAKTQEEKNQLHEVIDLIETNVMHAEGLNQINLAVNLLEGVKIDHPDTIDKALMALDHLIEAKHLTENTHDQIFIKANFFEGKVFMDYVPNTLKAKSCFEKVVNASEQKNLNTEEYRKAKDILDEILKEQLQEEEKIPTANREKILRELQQEIQKIKQADNSLGDQQFIDFLFTEYPPKHKENSKKPSIAANGSKKKAYLRLSMFYHPDKVDASEYGEKYKALCGEISKHINGRL